MVSQHGAKSVNSLKLLCDRWSFDIAYRAKTAHNAECRARG
jgi:hypothetical protein